MGLEEYQKKRNFSKTPEPKGTEKLEPGNSFVVQKHKAKRLHYDFRLEIDGVLKSWAIPKGPSLDPAERRLAVQVEDHPVEYKNFEGVIPPGEYGAGTVMIWDFGTYEPLGEKNLSDGLKKGEIRFWLNGKKLKGGFTLVLTRYRGNRKNWLLIKEKDEYARKGSNITEEQPNSAYSGKSIEEIAILK
ncbi:hypothetical protein J7J45_06490 [Candidatus Aerophobetes bacterium]|uniref:DNA ligase D 3'-phosphoesterase domain-containing protein n=1 Tax=Aerophobetes bacterium TaxID=2030807 RepID=A0A662DI86_UNCAE|nr:hypothetical protein [Candidatus Aerophobetes bacterium]RLE13839.1 MAG: hypothetical protein DRI96_02395 [Candidatus Aerophobetes bacterium]